MGDYRQLSRDLAALGIDLQATLDDEPRFLLDRGFLGALHVELVDQLGRESAQAALLQLGFLHGLRDAGLAIHGGFGPTLEALPGGPLAPRLAIRLSGAPAALELTGSWPERHEAEAVVETLGAVLEPSCHASAGYTSGWLSGLLDADLLAVEQHCAATGHAHCGFQVRDAQVWARSPEVRHRGALLTLPFAPLREVVGQHLARHASLPPPSSEGFQPGTPVVHVWGPVMVLPFSGAEDSLRALELIGRDRSVRQVRVVIVDVSGVILDEGFGAAALEQILDAIQSWGAEPMLTGVSPLSERVVADLERAHLVVHKDLPHAIAAGFQFADALRRTS